jgi:hypothetical protein
MEHVLRGFSDESARASRRGLGLMCLLHDRTAIVRTANQLGSDARPLALEALEVTVGRDLYPLSLGLLDPTMDAEERRAQLSEIAPGGVPHDPELLLSEIVEDPLERWGDPWLRACALHALVAVAPGRARAEARRFSRAPDPVTAETAAWVLATVSAAEA